ncbi:TPA: protease modulator HflC [Candidatus Poribacteria bacterium]|nr:protease modulator HflC [Candidatus Poribacteria bacterium]HIM11393.1 protease modulator HflC [Candidatus Poribacteria bacterium]
MRRHLVNNQILIILGIAIAVIILVFSGVFYIVPEGQQVIITQFGKPIGQPQTTSGLKIKTPFIQKVDRFDKRILEWDGREKEVTTKDKRFIWLDTTARWRISDALKFFQSLKTEERAQSRLDDIINSASRDLVTGQKLVEVVRNTNDIRQATEDLEEGEQNTQQIEVIEVGRRKIAQMILEKAQQNLSEEFGIEIVDVQIKRINYVDQVRQKVFLRMISERQRIASKYKSEGEGEAADIEGQKQKELQRIQSEAYKTAEQIKGQADAEAIQIYAEAHSKDPEFYAFTKTLETYQKTIGETENTKLFLTTDSDLYKYLKKP